MRVDKPSALGEWSYEAYDAKLATHPQPYFVFQLLFYSDQIARLQGQPAERMHVVLGTREVRSFRTRDFAAYARQVRERFEATVEAYWRGEQPPYPYPGRPLRVLRLVAALHATGAAPTTTSASSPSSPAGRRCGWRRAGVAPSAQLAALGEDVEVDAARARDARRPAAAGAAAGRQPRARPPAARVARA